MLNNVSWFFRQGGVTAFTGEWASCKTLALARIGLEGMHRGYEVWTNFGLEGSYEYHDLSEMVGLCATKDRVNRLLLIDEIGALLPPEEPAAFTPAMRLLWQEGRKLGFRVAYSTQDFSFVAKKVRMVTGRVVSCRGLFPVVRITEKGVRPVEYRPLGMVRAHYIPVAGEVRPSTGVKKRELNIFDMRAARSYDTYHLIMQAKQQLELELATYQERRVFPSLVDAAEVV